MNALEAASLVMIPSGYEDGTLGSLKPTDGTGDFTFSRGSNISATRVNADGNIEKGYENLLTYSNDLNQSVWFFYGAGSRIDGQAGYDGSNDAWLLTIDQFFRRSISSSSLVSFSAYVKKADSNGVSFLAASTFYKFDLTNSGNALTANSYIEDAGNGWFRCSFFTNSTFTEIRIYPSNESGVTESGSIYIQDAMLNQGMVAYPYVETTTAPVAGGILEDMPRLDYSGSCPALLLEPQRTNLLPHSEYNFSSTNGTIDYNNALSPEGYTNAIKFTSTGTAPHIRTFANQSVSNSTISAFVKYGNKQWVQFMLSAANTLYANFDIQNGVVGNIGTSTSNAKIEDYGNGWYRISATFSFVGLTSIRTYLIADGNANWASPSSVSGDYIYTYGWQDEQDATYPTSYIPTYGVSQTRLADVCVNAGDASTFNDNEGVLLFEGSALANANTGANFLSIGGTDSTNNRISIGFVNQRLLVEIKKNNVAQMLYTKIADISQVAKLAIKYKENDCKFYIDGVLAHSDTSVSLPNNLQQLNFSNPSAFNFYGNVNQVLYFPTALSDEACIELTTI